MVARKKESVKGKVKQPQKQPQPVKKANKGKQAKKTEEPKPSTKELKKKPTQANLKQQGQKTAKSIPVKTKNKPAQISKSKTPVKSAKSPSKENKSKKPSSKGGKGKKPDKTSKGKSSKAKTKEKPKKKLLRPIVKPRRSQKKYVYRLLYSQVRSYIWNQHGEDFQNWNQTQHVARSIWEILNHQFPKHKFTYADVEAIYKREFSRKVRPQFDENWVNAPHYFFDFADETIFEKMANNLWVVSPEIFAVGYFVRGGKHWEDDNNIQSKKQHKGYDYGTSCNGNIKRFVDHANAIEIGDAFDDHYKVYFRVKDQRENDEGEIEDDTGESQALYFNEELQRWEVELIICRSEGEPHDFSFLPVGGKQELPEITKIFPEVIDVEDVEDLKKDKKAISKKDKELDRRERELSIKEREFELTKKQIDREKEKIQIEKEKLALKEKELELRERELKLGVVKSKSKIIKQKKSAPLGKNAKKTNKKETKVVKMKPSKQQPSKPVGKKQIKKVVKVVKVAPKKIAKANKQNQKKVVKVNKQSLLQQVSLLERLKKVATSKKAKQEIDNKISEILKRM